MNGLHFLILGLATWRIVSLLARELGPFDIFSALRAFVGVEYDEKSEAFSETFFGKLILCSWCSSIWIGWMLAYVYLQSWDFFVYGLALSTIAIVIDSAVHRG